MSADLAGQLFVHPGAAVGATLRSTRPLLAQRLLEGRPVRQVPALVAAVYSLCAHAQRWTAERAVQAALGQPVAMTEADLQAHQAATAREHLLRIAHDWPRLWPGVAAAPGLRGCPLWPAPADAAVGLTRLADWLARYWLGEPAAAWWARCADDAEAGRQWAAEAPGALAAMLHPQAGAAQALATPGASLVMGRAAQAQVATMAQRMLDEPGFCALPDWAGQTADTGPWSRAHAHPGDQALQPQRLTVWDRWWARLRELVQLALPQGHHCLAHGAMNLGRYTGLAWTETARGLLVHVVQLSDDSPGARVLRYRVLAPTEWNFHPQGALGQALSALHAPGSEDEAHRLITAFDPCIGFELVGASAAQPLVETLTHA